MFTFCKDKAHEYQVHLLVPTQSTAACWIIIKWMISSIQKRRSPLTFGITLWCILSPRILSPNFSTFFPEGSPRAVSSFALIWKCVYVSLFPCIVLVLSGTLPLVISSGHYPMTSLWHLSMQSFKANPLLSVANASLHHVFIKRNYWMQHNFLLALLFYFIFFLFLGFQGCICNQCKKKWQMTH